MKWNSKLMDNTIWTASTINAEGKQAVANEIAAKVKNGEIIGAGSGSTSLLALLSIAKRVKDEHLKIRIIPTSIETAMTCSRMGLPMTSMFTDQPDWLFDGADEVDPDHNLIKGRGGALFKEKLLIRSSPKNFILVDQSKLVKTLGERFPIPIEIYPSALTYVESELTILGVNELTLRPAKGKDGPVITESGNLILDAVFKDINGELEKEIKSITGVIESGLFMNYPVEVIVARTQ